MKIQDSAVNDVRAAHLVSERWLADVGSKDPSVRIIDVRWYLLGKSGREEYARGHIPGSVFVALEDISADQGPGRHPIPSAEKFTAAMRAAGVSATTHVIAYDDAGGSIAARLLWLLHRYGHARASVLDGGLPAWTAAGLPLSTEAATPPAGDFVAKLDPSISALDKVHVNAARERTRSGDALILDARAVERYRGDSEPVDARPGHIPGAKSAPWSSNLREGRFKSSEELKEQYRALGAERAREVIVYCGSGVTACHDWLALKLAGVGGVHLYEGSWSDWARDPALPAATGMDDGANANSGGGT
ncbi:sulfurtransferase [Pendulispora albinea]|uniref:Sulfurtransferase n=1 Tax=Pendulispora albinea TaxID=2741071 RepID=A0ABZ2M377_9BACT